MIEQLQSFIQTYYIDPIFLGTGYNIYNTLTYAIILIASIFFVYWLIKKMNVAIDKKFFVGILPYIALGGALRAFQDSLSSANLLLITPLIYFTIFAVALSTLILSKLMERAGFKYHKIWFVWGAIILAIVVSKMNFINSYGAALMLTTFSLWVIVFSAIKFFAKRNEKINRFLSIENLIIILVHMFDASTTFVSLQFFPYFEQHVVPSFFISIFGPAAMFMLKLPVIIAVLYLLDKDMKGEKRTLIKIVILILGLAPGLRNFLRLFMGV